MWQYMRSIICRVVVIGKVASLVGKTVTITDGSESESLVFGNDLIVEFEVMNREKYTITSEGFSKTINVGTGDYIEVELGAFDRLWLYDRGNQFLDITGGFYRSGDNISVLRTLAEWNAADGLMYPTNNGGFYSGKSVDVTNYNILWVQIDPAYFNIPNTGMFVGLSSNQSPTSPAGWIKFVQIYYSTIGEAMWFPIDVSALTGSYYLFGYCSNGTNGYAAVRRIFLSKDTVNKKIPRCTALAFTGGVLSVDSVFDSNFVSWGAAFRQDDYTAQSGGYGAFAGNTCWLSNNNAVDHWCKVSFDTAKKVNAVRVDITYNYPCNTAIVQGSNDDLVWIDIKTFSGLTAAKGCNFAILSTDVTYKHYRVLLRGGIGQNYCGLTGFQLYELSNPNFIFKDLN